MSDDEDEKLCGVKKTSTVNAYLKKELVEMVYKKMDKGKFKTLTKTEVRNMSIVDLCKLLKLKVTEEEPATKRKKDVVITEEKVCTPRKVKEYPNAYTKSELVELALQKRLASFTEARKMKIKKLCNILDIPFIDVPVKTQRRPKPPTYRKVLMDFSSGSDSSEEEEDDKKKIKKKQDEEEEEEEDEPVHRSKDLKCIIKSKTPLKDHQSKVVNFINDDKRRGLLVVHSVGSGKTLTAVTTAECFIRQHKNGNVIVVTPTSLQRNFIKEMGKYGVSRKHFRRYQFYTIQAFAIASKKGEIDCRNSLLILDEAHNLRTVIKKVKKKKDAYSDDDNDDDKNCNEEVGEEDEYIQQGVNALALLNCAKNAKKVLLLTATPIVNSPYDILNLMAMIDGEDAMSKSNFRNMSPIELIDYLKCKVSFFSPDPKEREKDYPKTDYEEIFIKMNPQYFKKYEHVEKDELGFNDIFRYFAGTLNLVCFYNGVRRATNNLELENSPKVNFVMNKIRENPKSKFLIFSHFLKAGNELLEKRLKEAGIKYLHINGSLSIKKRNDVVNAYNSGKSKILLISKAGGEGLDLKKTNFVIILEPSWNKSTIEQVVGRAVRYKSHEDLPEEQRVVKVYELFAIKPTEKNSLDEILDKNLLRNEETKDILSIDLYLRNRSNLKQGNINMFLRKLQASSIEKIDCNKNIKNYEGDQFKEFYVKQDYEVCDGQCNKDKKNKKKDKDKKEKSKKQKPKKQEDESSEGEYEFDEYQLSSLESEEVGKKKPVKKSSDTDSDSESESDDEPVPPKKTVKQKEEIESESDLDSDDEPIQVKKAPLRKKKPVKKSLDTDSDSDSDSEDEPVPPKKQVKQKEEIESESDLDSDEPIQVKKAPPQKKKPVKKSSDTDSESDLISD